jgi:hypothetical protein
MRQPASRFTLFLIFVSASTGLPNFSLASPEGSAESPSQRPERLRLNFRHGVWMDPLFEKPG